MGRIIKHQRTRRCDRNTQMRWGRRDVEIVSRCMEASFSITGEDEAERIESVETLKYLGQILDRSDNDWPAVLCNVGKASQLWSRL